MKAVAPGQGGAAGKQDRDDSHDAIVAARQDGPLRSVLEAASAEPGCSAGAFSGPAGQNEDFRVDILTRHRVGFAVQAEVHSLASRAIHVRGFQYLIVSGSGPVKKNGLPLIDSRWSWTEQTRSLGASKAYDREDAL